MTSFEFFVVGMELVFFIGEEDVLRGDESRFFGASAPLCPIAVSQTLFMSTLTEGVYRIEVRFEGSVNPAIYEFCDEHTLNLPTGNLAFHTRETFSLGVVPPGTYRALVGWSSSQEAAHSFLGRREDYPQGDGPDGVVILTWLRPCSAEEAVP